MPLDRGARKWNEYSVSMRKPAQTFHLGCRQMADVPGHDGAFPAITRVIRTPEQWRKRRMRNLLAGAALAMLMAQAAMAQTIAVSMALFDDNFLTVLRNGIETYAETLDGVTVQIEDAAERRRQAARPDPQLRRLRRRRDHRQPGRHLGDRGDVQSRRRRRHPARLCQPRADQRRRPARRPGLRRLRRGRIRHAGDQGSLPPAQGGRQDRGCQRLRPHGRALEPGRAAAHPGHPRRDRHGRLRLHVNIIDEQTGNWSRDPGART